MATNGIHDFPPKSGQIFDGFQLEDCLKSSSNCVVHVCHHIKDISLKFVAKIGIKREATKLVNELKYYQDLEGGDGIPQLIHHKRFVKNRFVFNIFIHFSLKFFIVVIRRTDGLSRQKNGLK